MGRDPNDKICGRCGSDVRRDTVDGRRCEQCLCLVRLEDERMPDAWHFAYEQLRVPR